MSSLHRRHRHHRPERHIRNEDDDEDEGGDGLVTTGVVPVPVVIREAAENLIGHASIAVTTLNVLCTVVGGAVLALPSAIERMSFVPGAIFMGATCFLSWFAVILIARACARTGLLTFQDLAVHASRNNYFFVRFFFFGLFAFPVGIIVAFMKVIAESMPSVMKFVIGPSSFSDDDWILKQGFWICFASLVLIPLCSFRQMSELVWVSVVGFGTVLFTGLTVIYLFFSGRYTMFYDADQTPSRCTDAWMANNNTATAARDLHASLVHPGIALFDLKLEDFFVAFPVMTMALTCHNNVPFFYGELKQRSEARMMKAVYLAGSFTTVFYLAVAICGYFIFGPSIRLAHGNVLNCMSWADSAVVACRALMAVHFLCIYPLNCISARRVLNRILYPDVDESKLSQWKLTSEAICLVGISAVAAFNASGIEVVFALNGSIFGLLLTFALPSYCYIRLVNSCSLSDLWMAARAPLETSSVGSEEDQELGDFEHDVAAVSTVGVVAAAPGETEETATGAGCNTLVSSSSSSSSSSSGETSPSDDEKNTDAESGDWANGRDLLSDNDDAGAASDDDDDDVEFKRSEKEKKKFRLDGDDGNHLLLSNRAEKESVSEQHHDGYFEGNAVGEQQRQEEGNETENNGKRIDFSALTSPRQVRERSSVMWRLSVWGLLLWGSVGTVCSFVFSVHAALVGDDEV